MSLECSCFRAVKKWDWVVELLLSSLVRTGVFLSFCLFGSVREYVFDVDRSGVLLGCGLVKSVVICFQNLIVSHPSESNLF